MGFPSARYLGISYILSLSPMVQGGAIITWRDGRSGNYDIYAQRVSGSGVVQWTADGVPICTASGDHWEPQLVSDGSGGAIITWQDTRSGNGDIYAQRVDASGTVQWTTGGVPICTASGTQWEPQLVSDGAGGAIITWQDGRSGNGDIYAQRVDSSGVVQWTADGVPICTVSGDQLYPQLVSDGAGGAIITWRDGRSGNYDIYAQRVSGSGVVQWTADGVPICMATNDQESPQLVSDGGGGAIISWHDWRSGNPDIYVQRVDASGTAQWAADGVAICTATGDQWWPRLVSDGAGGAIISWGDRRNDWGDIYAQRVGPEGQTGGWPLISGIKDVPHDQGGWVVLHWMRSGMDSSPLGAITYYSIWRAISDGQLASLEAKGAKQVTPAEVGPDFCGPAYRVTRRGGSQFYWEWIANQPAHYFQNYAYTAATLFDSTSATDGWHYFLVSAHTSDPFVFWDSEPDSGYSVDNLAPAKPEGLQAQGGNRLVNLVWQSNLEPDLAYYAVYRGKVSGFVPHNPIDYAIDTTYQDTTVENDTTYYYRVSAFDFSDNESEYSDEVSCTPVGVPYDAQWSGLPRTFSLSQNYPNPFNPVTEIRYALPKPCQVKLEVFNLLGQRVAILVDGYQPAGYRRVRWDGSSMASGIYLYRLKAGGFSEVRRMVLLK